MNTIHSQACEPFPAKTLISLSLVVCAIVFALLFHGAGDGLLRDADILWHIEVGRRIMTTSSFPWVDELSHTFEGHRWIAKEWLSQVIFNLAYNAGGWSAVAAVAVGAVALTFSLLFAELARQMRLTAALSIAVFAYTLSTPHFVARPHLLSYPIAVLWIAGLVRAVENRTSPSLLLLPLMTLWANLHGGFSLGLAVGGLLLLEAVFESDREHRLKTLFRWATFLGAAAIASLITPYGYHSLFVTAQVFGGNEALSYINEWRPINFARDTLVGPLITAILFLCLLFGVKIKLMRLIVVTSLFYLMLVHIRFVSIFAVVAPLMIASSLLKEFPYLSLEHQIKTQPTLFKNLNRVLRPSYAVFLLIIIVGSSLSISYSRGLRPHDSIYPASTVDYILRTDPNGRIYNDYSFGGYLIFRGVKTFIDGRSDQLFGNGFMSRAFEIVKRQDDQFLALLDEYQITSALVSLNSNEAVILDRAPFWQRRYADHIAVVYQRRVTK